MRICLEMFKREKSAMPENGAFRHAVCFLLSLSHCISQKHLTSNCYTVASICEYVHIGFFLRPKLVELEPRAMQQCVVQRRRPK
jgi:hypothetical protein